MVLIGLDQPRLNLPGTEVVKDLLERATDLFLAFNELLKLSAAVRDLGLGPRLVWACQDR
jgi:hypothetical protein